MKCFKVVVRERNWEGNFVDRRSLYFGDLHEYGYGKVYPPLQEVTPDPGVGPFFACRELETAKWLCRHSFRNREVWECEGEEVSWEECEEILELQSEVTNLYIDYKGTVFLKSVTLTKFVC